MIIKDPLKAFFEERTRLLGDQQPFEGGEHLWVGNEGARVAHESLELNVADFGPFKRKSASEMLSYGEIVAFSGDFYETPDDLFEEKPSPLPWLYQGNDLEDIRQAFLREVDWIRIPPTRRMSYPDANIALWWNAKRFVELALKNTPHYGWHNAVMFARWHQAALELAEQAAAESDETKKSLIWRRAVFTNGFADHFLTDGFAAGHVRTPAGQIREWAEKQEYNEKLAGALLKLLHDQDGHVKELHGEATHRNGTEGLRVQNARGDDWYTRCDGQMFLTGADEPAVTQTVSAVAESVKQLLKVYHGGAIAPGVFPASSWIPWVHPLEPQIIQKFPASLDKAGVERLFDSIQWYVKMPGVSAGVRPRHIAAFLSALPSIMEAFRGTIRQESADPLVKKRLDPRFIAAYQEIR